MAVERRCVKGGLWEKGKKKGSKVFTDRFQYKMQVTSQCIQAGERECLERITNDKVWKSG